MAADLAALHVGKLDKRVETSLPEAMDAWIAKQAFELGLREADFIRELIFKGATGTIYSVHVAHDKEAAFDAQQAKLRGCYRTGTGDAQ